MSFFESVIKKTRKLESLLEEKYQASGRGLHEKATSVENKLNADLVRQLRFIASVRNKLLHEDGYSFDGSEQNFLGKCDDAIARLESQPRYTPPAPEPKSTYTYTPPSKPTTDSSSTAASHTSPSTYSPSSDKTSAGASSYSGRESSANIEANKILRDFYASLPAYFAPMALISFVGWLIVGTGACLNRFANSPIRPEDAGYGNNKLFKYIFAAYLYEGLVVVGVVFAIGILLIFLKYLLTIKRAAGIRSGKRSLGGRTIITALFGLVITVLGGIWGIPKILNLLSSATNTEPSSITQPSGETPKPDKIIKADKVTKGRTANEKVHEFIVPPNQWVETKLQITTNQEVMIHHFASNEPVKVSLGGITDTRLQKAGTILPLYTSVNCSNDKGVKAKVQYTCINLTQSEGIKLYAAKSVRVGVVVKNR